MPGLPATLTAITPTSQSATVSTPVLSAPAVRVADLDGFPVPGVSVTFSVTSGGGSVNPVGAITTDADGVARLTSWTLGASPGANTVLASTVGVTGITFSATGTALVATTIAAASATSQQAVVGTAVPAAPRVRVTGASSVPVAKVIVTFTVSAGGGKLGGAVSAQVVTGADGIAQAPVWTMGLTPGANSVQASVLDLSLSGEPVVFTATGLTAGAVVMLPNSTLTQVAQVSTGVSSKPSVKVLDANFLPVAGVTVSFAVATGGGSVSPASVVTNASGIATLTSWTLGASPGTNNNSVTATVSGLAGSPITFLASGSAGAPGSGTTPTTIAANSSTSQSAQVGTAVVAPPSVLVTDAGAVAVSGVSVTFAVTSGGGQIGATSVVTNGSGIATLPSWVLGPLPGTNNNTVTATVDGLTGSPVLFTATGAAGTGQLTAAAYREALYVSAVEKLYVSGGAQSTGGTGNIVRVFDARTRQHLTDIIVGNGARGLVYANGKVYVALSAGNIAVINTATDTLATTITIAGTWVRGVYVSTIDRVVFVRDTTGSVIQVNPSTDTQSQLIASVATIGHIVYSSSNDRLYIPTGSNTVAVYNPSTGALVTTISGDFQNSEAMCAVYASTSPDGVFCTATTSGSTRRLAVITPSSNTVRGYLSLGTTGTFSGGLYVSETERIYVIRRDSATGPLRSSIGTIDPETDTLERYDPAAAGVQRLGGFTPSYATFWQMHDSSGQPIWPWCTTTRSGAIRTKVTDSQPDAPHAIVEESEPFAVGDLLMTRRNVEGSYRTRLEWPAQIDVMNGLVLERFLPDDTIRGERNYVLNPWARDWTDGYRAKGGWILPTSHESRWRDRDISAWLSTTATVDGAHGSGVTTINYRNLTVGDVLEPGDYIAVVDRSIIERAVVDGAGRVSVKISSSAGPFSDGAAHTLRRPPAPGYFAPGGVVIMARNTGNAEASVQFAVPYYSGLTSLWGTVEAYLWVANGSIQPSIAFSLRTFVATGQINETFCADATVYTDQTVLLGPYILSYRHTLEPGDGVKLTARLLAGSNSTIGLYLRRFQATLGPEPDIEPPMEFNADFGNLFHAGQRALRDRGQAPVQYVCRVRELSLDAPIEVGGDVELRHPTQGVIAEPRVLSVTRTVTPGAQTPESPEIELDNLPPSLNRKLAASGIV